MLKINVLFQICEKCNIKINLVLKGLIELTAAIDGFLSSPAAGWVTSAPKNITGSVLKKDGL